MKKIFIDTNVILDFVLCREGANLAEQILLMGVNKQIELCTSILSMANVAYIARKERTKEQLYKVMGNLTLLIKTLPMDEMQLLQTIAKPTNDFEDMLQYQCALACQCDAIVTRNTKHFLFSDIHLFTPQELISEM